MTIVENVRWERVGARTRVFYRVVYSVYGSLRAVRGLALAGRTGFKTARALS